MLHRKLLGSEHPDTLRSLGKLAISYHLASRQDVAIALGEKVLALCRKVLGDEHPDAQRYAACLANFKPAATPPPAFRLSELAGKAEAEWSSLLGKPDLIISGEGKDEETGFHYDEERSYPVDDLTLDLFFLAGKTRQVNLTTGFNGRLRGIAAVRAYLGYSAELGVAEKSGDTTFHRVRFEDGSEGRIYVEFDDKGITDTFKMVMPEVDAACR